MSFSRGERVREWGDSACEKPLRCAEQGWLMYTLIKKPRRRSHFANTLGAGLDNPRKWGIIGIAVRLRERVAETQLKEDER
jgi:hypothetical protein